MESNDKKEKDKHVYKKPVLRIIELATDEVMALGCKLAGGGSAFALTPCVNINNCSAAGS